MDKIFIYGIVFIFGTLIGSFLNVCIYRIPLQKSVATGRSHCMSCNKNIKWYDLIPVFSFIFLRAKCRHCKSKISIQYPLIEAINGLLYLTVFYVYGWEGPFIIILNIIYSIVISTLIVLSVIDIRTQTIPNKLSVFLLILGFLATLTKIFLAYYNNASIKDVLLKHGIGFFAVSGLLLLIFYATGGRGIGGGDVKLMAGAGLLLGWDIVIVAFLTACFLATIIHLIKMIFKNADRVFAFGPYLSVGIIIGMLYGKDIISWYLATFLYM